MQTVDYIIQRKMKWRDFPSGPVAKFPCCPCKGPSSISGQQARSHMLQLRLVQPNKKNFKGLKF